MRHRNAVGRSAPATAGLPRSAASSIFRCHHIGPWPRPRQPGGNAQNAAAAGTDGRIEGGALAPGPTALGPVAVRRDVGQQPSDACEPVANCAAEGRDVVRDLLSAAGACRLHSDSALFTALEGTIRPTDKRQLIRVPLHINDPQFAELLVTNFKEALREH
nr:Tm-1-like ATP-binding domain-containing protein [Ensifer sp. LCM 4579]